MFEISSDKSLFMRFAQTVSRWTGSSWAFCIAFAVIIIWAITGPMFGFSDTWQLVINTGTTIVTFLMVFLIQNTQNRDSHAMQLKLDELIRTTQGAHLALLDIEELTDEEQERIRCIYKKLAEDARELLDQGKSDANTPELNTDEFLHTKRANGLKKSKAK